MLNSRNITINLNKIKKIWFERGAKVLLRQFAYLGKKKLSRRPVKKNLKTRDAFLNHIDKDMLNDDIELIFTSGLLRSSEHIKKDIRSLPSEVSGKIISEAQNILGNEFTIYGRLKLQVVHDPFSWLRDPMTTHVWSIQSNAIYQICKKPTGTDIKNIWELSRFQYLFQLVYAYIVTRDESYSQFAIQKVISWIDENPFPLGPHWTRAMEASIRILNWAVYLPLLNVSSFCKTSFVHKLTKSILEHFIYIRENLEVSPYHSNNHYIANLVALLLCRLIFPSLPWALETSNFAEKEFEREVQRQFKISGINFEGSLPYHRLSSEICLMGVALIKKSGRDVPDGIVKCLRKVAEFTRYYAEISEECPLIGDNDSGIFVKFFVGQELNCHKYLIFFFDCVLGDEGKPDDIDNYLCSIHFKTYGQPYSSIKKNLVVKSNSEFQAKDFGGLIICRHENEAFFFNALRSYEGHTHNDKLSVYPVIGSKLLFVDRGSFSYTGFTEIRHEDRITASHNGPVINGWEQSRIWKNDVFYINGEAKCDNHLDFRTDVVVATGWHTGYERYKRGLKTFRKVKWDIRKRTILISDWAEGKNNTEEYHFTWYFLINPLWTAEVNDSSIVFSCGSHSVTFWITNKTKFSLGKSFYCPSYQTKSSCQDLKISHTTTLGKKVQFLISY